MPVLFINLQRQVFSHRGPYLAGMDVDEAKLKFGPLALLKIQHGYLEEVFTHTNVCDVSKSSMLTHVLTILWQFYYQNHLIGHRCPINTK